MTQPQDRQPAREPRRARHLLDLTAPAASRHGGGTGGSGTGSGTGSGMSLSTVQRWVMSTLAVTTVLHLVVGIVVAAAYLETTRPGAQEGLLVIAGVMGVLGVAAAFLIHQRSALTPWVLLGAVPAVVGAVLVL